MNRTILSQFRLFSQQKTSIIRNLSSEIIEKRTTTMTDNNKKLIDCWLDCDPGHDDAFAIILAAYSGKIKLGGMSTVSGNQTIEKTTKNALNVLNLIGLVNEKPEGGNVLDFPLIQGAAKPLMRPGVICDEIHGD